MSVYNGASNRICKYIPENEAIHIAFVEEFCLIFKKFVNFWILAFRLIITKESITAIIDPPKKE